MQQGVTLDTIGGGALAELFKVELQRVLNNIDDPNTDAGAKRAISIDVVFTPGAERNSAAVSISCTSKLSGIKRVSTQVYMGRRDGKLIAVESNPHQSTLFDPPMGKSAATGTVAAFPAAVPQPDGGQ
jgi:hypothetical protein